ncbi:TetR/AcrR family transcriptional regulator [Kitasatospora sp. MMS16-BH015]|uniref:TetR/AcrR family transcriptional regulator n=1 Tax=Kitasatospora sp. MMS16-BH015 TaxID=2018025 RepID=UPI000CF2C12A|nr:TetR/AcrR family transcriptional regulator [Kitasatospora sp. MMS16-BH015]
MAASAALTPDSPTPATPAPAVPAPAAPASPDSPEGGGRARRAGYRRLPVQQRREQLIAVALELFSSRPPEEVSLDDVAEAAGASRPLVYRYFGGGKQQLYEAALRSAAEELTSRFSITTAGPPSEQLAAVLDSYFSFVAEHGTGYGALLRGGSVVETARTSAIVDEVRRVALRRTLRYLGVREAGPRLTLLVRSWISVVEGASLTWLDEGRQIPRESLRDWLVDEFIAMTAATAAHDDQAARVLELLLTLEAPGSAAGELAGRLRELGKLRNRSA